MSQVTYNRPDMGEVHQMHQQPTGTTFELDGQWYVIVETRHKFAPKRADKMVPQPSTVGQEYIHADGKTHVCANRRCSNLVPRSKNLGVERLNCSRRCTMAVSARRYQAREGGRRHLVYDPLNRLSAVFLHCPKGPKAQRQARDKYLEHLDGLVERCPEATEASNFSCPGGYNPNCLTKEKWVLWHQGGPWPGVCLIYATLKDHYAQAKREEVGQPGQRQYTFGRGESWHWRDEVAMLPLPEGIIRA